VVQPRIWLTLGICGYVPLAFIHIRVVVAVLISCFGWVPHQWGRVPKRKHALCLAMEPPMLQHNRVSCNIECQPEIVSGLYLSQCTPSLGLGRWLLIHGDAFLGAPCCKQAIRITPPHRDHLGLCSRDGRCHVRKTEAGPWLGCLIREPRRDQCRRRR
jgi:hypothetical protein